MKLYVDPNVLFNRNTTPPPPVSSKKKEFNEFKAYLRVKKVMDKMDEERKKAEAEKKKKEEEKKGKPINPWLVSAILFFLSPTITVVQLMLVLKLFKNIAN